MSVPRPGFMGFHDGHPIEILHKIRTCRDGEEWLVKPIFIENPKTRVELFRAGDRLTPIHTQHK